MVVKPMIRPGMPVAWSVVVLFNNDRRALGSNCRPGRRRLHRLNHRVRDASLLERDEIDRLERCRDAMVLDVRDNQGVGHPGLGHHHHIVDRHHAWLHLTTQLGSNLCPIVGLNLVERTTDGRPSETANAGPNRRASPRIAQCVADHRADSSAGEPTKQRAAIGMVRRLATGRNDTGDCDQCN